MATCKPTISGMASDEHQIPPVQIPVLDPFPLPTSSKTVPGSMSLNTARLRSSLSHFTPDWVFWEVPRSRERCPSSQPLQPNEGNREMISLPRLPMTQSLMPHKTTPQAYKSSNSDKHGQGQTAPRCRQEHPTQMSSNPPVTIARPKDPKTPPTLSLKPQQISLHWSNLVSAEFPRHLQVS